GCFAATATEFVSSNPVTRFSAAKNPSRPFYGGVFILEDRSVQTNHDQRAEHQGDPENRSEAGADAFPGGTGGDGKSDTDEAGDAFPELQGSAARGRAAAAGTRKACGYMGPAERLGAGGASLRADSNLERIPTVWAAWRGDGGSPLWKMVEGGSPVQAARGADRTTRGICGRTGDGEALRDPGSGERSAAPEAQVKDEA